MSLYVLLKVNYRLSIYIYIYSTELSDSDSFIFLTFNLYLCYEITGEAIMQHNFSYRWWILPIYTSVSLFLVTIINNFTLSMTADSRFFPSPIRYSFSRSGKQCGYLYTNCVYLIAWIQLYWKFRVGPLCYIIFIQWKVLYFLHLRSSEFDRG